MKFGKLLQELIDGNPQMSEQPLIRYKELKKHLKSIKRQQDAAQQDGQQQQQQPAALAAAAAQVAHQKLQQQLEEEEDEEEGSEPDAKHPGLALQPEQDLPADLSAEEQAFITMLNEDLCRFNRFFMDKEEEAVIKLQALADRIQAAQRQRTNSSQQEDTQELKAALVDFHGEMVLLLHWSLLNYAAVVKILKKHDKQSGLLLRAPYLANVLQQPFYSTSIMSRLVKMAEGHIESLVAQEAREGDPAAAAAATAAAVADEAEGTGQQLTTTATPAAAAAGAAGSGPSAQQATAAAGADDDGGRPHPPSAATAAGAGAADTQADSGPNGEPGAGSDTDTEELLAGTAVCARTRVALQTWQQLCTNASTPSTILPANSSQALVRALNVRQRWAKIVSMAPIMRDVGMEAGAAAGAGGAALQEGAGQVEPPAEQQQLAEAGRAGADAVGPDSALAGQKHKDEAEPAEQGSTGAKRQKLDS